MGTKKSFCERDDEQLSDSTSGYFLITQITINFSKKVLSYDIGQIYWKVGDMNIFIT
jgi:hypothetical protein